MYQTRPWGFYKSCPNAVSEGTHGPNSGYLAVHQDKETTPTDLPIPQTNPLVFSCGDVYLFPVLNKPLSSNLYYVIKADGKHRGEAYANLKNKDAGMCCFKNRSKQDVNPRPFDPMDIYQQFRFTKSSQPDKLIAECVAPDGHPPDFLLSTEWKVSSRAPKSFTLAHANGLHSSLRAYQPNFNFPLSQQCSKPIVIGKWYCPFMFVNEEKDELFYQMTLEQRWQRIFSTPISNQDIEAVKFNLLVPTVMVRIGGNEAVELKKKDGRRVVWFRSKEGKEEEEVGLSTVVVKRMMWEEEKGGWVHRKQKKVRVVKEEEYGRLKWTKYGCYALIESFVLRRSDKSVVLTYDFVHSHQLKSKWE